MPSKTLSPREELLKIQKKVFARNQSFIRSQALVKERGFEAYEGRYRRRVRSYRSVASQDELIAAIRDADIIYLGDYHTNKQSQRTLLRLLRSLVQEGTPVSLGLELVLKKHQKNLNLFLADKISEETFLKKVQFRKHWYFDLWQNFKPIFDFAKEHQLPVFGIEKSLATGATLPKRDANNAKIIMSAMEQHPNSKMIVFVGDLHVAPEHLPHRVQEEFRRQGKKKKELIIYQNSESIYWKLAEEEKENHVEIVKIADHEYCVINTPPVIWQQSYLNWIECEEGAIDYEDVRANFIALLKMVSEFLEIDLAKLPDYEEVEVFTSGDLGFLKKLSEDERFTKKQIDQIKKHILSSESYIIPLKKYVYLSNLSINHASEEASHYLKILCSGTEFPRSVADAFYANAVHEALGFFGSKIVNHKRKCFHEKEYSGLVSYLNAEPKSRARSSELEIALLVLKHREMDKRGVSINSKRFFKNRMDIFMGVTHGLGYMLGDRLFHALMEDKVSKEEVHELFFDSMREEGTPFKIYTRLWKKLRGIKIPKRV